ncbi:MULTISPECIES: hypothetical protein [Streptomyces]|nr:MULTISPECIES: hypothetical protein [Streptomyces]QIB47246.1 hypothetical protein G3H79_33345 [Streptomyces aureoverticillatus]
MTPSMVPVCPYCGRVECICPATAGSVAATRGLRRLVHVAAVFPQSTEPIGAPSSKPRE